ncbi:MAG: cell wall metabolism sensor histidine kinase WalK [Gammaproteobacteria bacterium]|nr:cell wall metabolism sensor histidine kinase WalK [Gammaproteobacteria bacterium]
MGLRLKFNLILVAIFIAGFATVAVIAHRYLQTQAVDDAKRVANMMLDAAAIANIDARIASGLGSRIIEMKVREFDASEPQSGVEGDAIRKLQSQQSQGQNAITDMFVTTTGQAKLVLVRQIRVADAVTRIRTAVIDYNNITMSATLALTTFLSSLGVVFLTLFIVLNILLDRLIVRPVAEMSAQADAVSVGNFSVPEFKPTNQDEISVLGIAFNRLRRSTEEAIKLLK